MSAPSPSSPWVVTWTGSWVWAWPCARSSGPRSVLAWPCVAVPVLCVQSCSWSCWPCLCAWVGTSWPEPTPETVVLGQERRSPVKGSHRGLLLPDKGSGDLLHDAVRGVVGGRTPHVLVGTEDPPLLDRRQAGPHPLGEGLGSPGVTRPGQHEHHVTVGLVQAFVAERDVGDVPVGLLLGSGAGKPQVLHDLTGKGRRRLQAYFVC